MIIAERNKMFYVFGILSIFLIPFVFLNLPSWHFSIQKFIYIIIIVEYLIYFLLGLLQTDKTQTIHLLIYSLIMYFARFTLCLTGGIIYFLMSSGHFSEIFIQLWIGNPLAQLLQIFLMIYFAPYIIINIAPGLLKENVRKIFNPQEAQKQKSENPRESHYAEPVGGFIRVYSFPELQSCFRKTIGLEGFIIYSNEGLVVWEDLAINFDIQKLVIKFMQIDKHVETFVKDFDFIISEKFILETSEHMLFNVKLDYGFYLMAFFNKKIQVAEIYPRMKVLIKSTQELIRSKYQNVLI